MNEQRIEALEKQYYALSARVERLDQTEKRHDFTIRDSAVKIGIAEGLAETSYKEISQLKLEMYQLRAEIKELRTSTHQQFEGIHEKLDRQEAMTKENGETLNQHGELLRQILARLQ